MDKQIWKIMMAATLSVMGFGFLMAIVSFEYHLAWGMYTGLFLIAGVCVSWWFWVMFIIRSMFTQSERTRTQIAEVRNGLYEIRQLVKEYAELTNPRNRKWRKPTTARTPKSST